MNWSPVALAQNLLATRWLVAFLMVTLWIGDRSQCWATQDTQESAVQITRVQEVIENWTPTQHLFVKGDVGVSAEQLGKLEGWLDENGRHWTVVLMHHASDETYQAPDGERFRGMDAVEFALAHRLANQTEFGELVHEKTGETSGAVFVLYLVERKLAYYSSDVHDRRGLGESRWIGNLDRDAIRAMRSGDRIIDAVKDTIKSIETRLKKKIQQEIVDQKRARERFEFERRRSLENLRALIEETESVMLARIEESAREIRAKFADAKDSELANPPIEAWRDQLMTLRKKAANPAWETIDVQKSIEFKETRKSVTEIRQTMNRFLDSYAAHAAFENMIYSIEARLDAIADHPSGAAADVGVEAYELLNEVRGGHARGELGFASNIAKVRDLIDQGEQAIELEQRRLKQESERAQLVRRTLTFVAMGLAALFLITLWILNIRRRPALRRAHALFGKTSKAAESELAKIEEVVGYSEKVIGTPEVFAEKRLEGKTLKLGSRTVQQIGNLQAIAAEIQRVLGACSELLHPSNPIAEAANMFSGARYAHGVNELNGKSLQVPGRIDEHGVAGKPLWMSFDELFTDLHQRKNLAISGVEEFEQSFKRLPGKLAELKSRIDETAELEQKVSRASRLDRLFRIPALFERLLPAAQQDYDRAAAYADSDPVRAITEQVPAGMRKITDGLSVARTIENAREVIFPKLHESTRELKTLGFDTRWIDERVEELSDMADEVVSLATDQACTDEAAQFDADVVSLGLRATRSCELARQVVNEAGPSLELMKQKVAEQRQLVARQLGIDASKALHEENYDPDVELEQAEKQLQSARAALDYGGVESAMESLEVLEIESEHAERLVEMTLKSVNEFKSNHDSRNRTYEKLSRRVAELDSSIASIQSRYADSAMVLRDEEFVGGTWDELEPDDDAPTVGRALKASEQLLNQGLQSIRQAYTKHFSGRVLESANTMDLVKTDFENVDQVFTEITEHCTRIDRLALENVEVVSSRLARMGSLVREVNDSRTQAATIKQHADLKNSLERFETEFKDEGFERDPFGDAIRLNEFETDIEALAAALAADRYAFEEASRAVGGAESELRTANRLVETSINDKIPDSRTVEQCQDEVKTLAIQLDDVKQQLRHPHENWHLVDLNATQINSKLAVINGRLRQELELAKQAVQVMSEAAEAVYAAANWRGSYNIVVIGQPGVSELEDARRALAQGNYHRAVEFSKAAKTRALNAIEAAKDQVTRHRRKLARQAAEARRRRMSSSSFGIGSSSSSRRSSGFSGFGSSSSSRSSRSRSSSSRSSSSRSSSSRSSGFSRSGW